MTANPITSMAIDAGGYWWTKFLVEYVGACSILSTKSHSLGTCFHPDVIPWHVIAATQNTSHTSHIISFISTHYHVATMIASRSTLRAATRGLKLRTVIRQARHESTSSSTNTSSSSHLGPSLIGGLAGGTLVFLGGYAWYRQSGAHTLISTVSETQASLQNMTKRLKESSPEPNEALKWLRQTATSYAAIIPGAKGYIDSAFNDLDEIHAKHADEVDAIVKEAYNELKGVSQESGMSVASAQKTWEILQRYLNRIADLAVDSAQEIMNNHPALKEKVGGNLDRLKQLGDNYGPEAKKQVDQTWEEIRNILKNGANFQSISKIQALVQDKTKKLQELGQQAWEKGMEQAKPYLDKSPKVKQLVDENKDALKQGNAMELYNKIKDSVSSGNTESLEKYIKNAVNKARQGGDSSGGGGLEQYLNMIPGASEIMPKLGQLRDIAQKHGPEAEKIAKETYDEMQQVLQRKLSEAEKIAEKAKKESR